jgi:hypothetical protein
MIGISLKVAASLAAYYGFGAVALANFGSPLPERHRRMGVVAAALGIAYLSW